MSLKEYQIGDKIIECKPFVQTLKDDKKTKHCDHCFKSIVYQRNNKYVCDYCLQMYYCCFQCKLSDKALHRKECLIFKVYYYPYLKHHFYRLILRSYLMTVDNKDIQTQEYDLYNGNKRSFNGLEDHSSDIRSDSNRFKQFKYIYETIFYFSKEFQIVFNYEYLYQLFCRLVINHFDIIQFNGTNPESIGSAVYLKAAILNHSCEPNAAVIYFGSVLVLKAIKQIRIGEEVTISYVDLEIDRFRRQSRLKKYFYFDCQCIKCESNDFNINYKSLDQFKQEFETESQRLRPDWTLISQMSDKIIEILHQIYGEFDPQLILVLIDILKVKYKNKSENNKQLNCFVKDLKQRVQLIYGINHKIYDIFLNCTEKEVFKTFYT